MARAGNNPKRRIAAHDQFEPATLADISRRASYVGSANHKRFPGDYGFDPPVNPRPWKSLCDKERIILIAEAQSLLKAGIIKGMISTHFESDLPKYIWAVDNHGRPFEAKTGLGGYHGYMLEADDDMADLVLKNWRVR